MLTLLVCAFVLYPIALGMLKFACRLIGFTVRMVFGVLLLPLWIVLAAISGLAVAARFLLPLMLIVFVCSLLVPEG